MPLRNIIIQYKLQSQRMQDIFSHKTMVPLQADKEKLHEGVVKDTQRQQRRKIENLYTLQQQIEMSKTLKKQQNQDDEVALKLLEDFQKKDTR